jgi:tetratricopeptide (TPR) repeat protein
MPWIGRCNLLYNCIPVRMKNFMTLRAPRTINDTCNREIASHPCKKVFLIGLAMVCVVGQFTISSEKSLQTVRAFQESEDKGEITSLSQRVKQWRDACLLHTPGRSDAPAVAIGKWTAHDMASVLTFIGKLSAQPAKSATRTLARGQIRRLLALTDEEVKDGSLDRVLKQGAILHTDIAILELGIVPPENTAEIMGVFADGRLLFSSYNLHWQYARQLLDSVRQASHDPLVHQWYIATTAYMQSRRDFGYSERNLKSALNLFPQDARLLFYEGVQHETYASPVSQNQTLPSRFKMSYGSRESELRLARQSLQKAISPDQDFIEARLHLGRVLGLLGNHPLAVAQLRKAVDSIKDPQLLYYAFMFLAFEMETYAQHNEARDYYERAATLFPTAQSPLLSLSQLAGKYNDPEGALSILQRVFALKIADFWKDDPWWSYDLSHVRNSRTLIEEMHRLFGALPR